MCAKRRSLLLQPIPVLRKVRERKKREKQRNRGRRQASMMQQLADASHIGERQNSHTPDQKTLTAKRN
jgi:hypothetical protein